MLTEPTSSSDIHPDDIELPPTVPIDITEYLRTAR